MNRSDAAEMILVLDFGGQYNQLIARRVRENHVYCEVYPHTISLEHIRGLAPRGLQRNFFLLAFLCSVFVTGRSSWLIYAAVMSRPRQSANTAEPKWI